MSVQSAIDRIITAVGNAYSKVSEKGGTVPASQTVSNLATAIESIPSGGGTLITKTITQNGTYNASADNADGYSQVTVDVSGGGGITDLAGTSWNFDTITPQSLSAFMNGINGINMGLSSPLTFSYTFNERTYTTEITQIIINSYTSISLKGADTLDWNGSWSLFGTAITNVSIMNIPPSSISTNKLLISFFETLGTRIE